MMTLPVASIRSASGGTAVASIGPTARIFPSATTTVPRSIAGPAIGSTRPPTKATGWSWPQATPAEATSAAAMMQAAMMQAAWVRRRQ
jgi:hypothetical protein